MSTCWYFHWWTGNFRCLISMKSNVFFLKCNLIIKSRGMVNIIERCNCFHFHLSLILALWYTCQSTSLSRPVQEKCNILIWNWLLGLHISIYELIIMKFDITKHTHKVQTANEVKELANTITHIKKSSSLKPSTQSKGTHNMETITDIHIFNVLTHEIYPINKSTKFYL